ncbi:MAG: TonB-dependent receptor [Bacteroidetes bacterium]|nr:TonB-dependent receptor [Bacteroidota bacterium]
MAPFTVIFAQQVIITGNVLDQTTKEKLAGVSVVLNDTSGVSTNASGIFKLITPEGKQKLEFRLLGYESYTQVVDANKNAPVFLDIRLKPSGTDIGTVVVSASKFEQRLSDVVVSMNVLKPRLLENNNHVNMDKALEQIPGVTMVDGQANIRGGSGFSYGAGSRVLLLVDDLPMLTADASDVKWSFLPVENLEQIEVIKGASSALFGSSALNGIINIRTAYPKDVPQTKINFFSGLYDKPQLMESRWWGNEDLQATNGFNFLHSQKFGQFDFVWGGLVYNSDGYRIGDNEQRFRTNTNLRYRFKKIAGLSIGINANYQRAQGTNFFIWADDTTGALTPYTGTSSEYNTQRILVDPFATYVSNTFGTHKLRFRNFNTRNYNNTNQQAFSNINFFEYQYQQRFADMLTVTAGVNAQASFVKGELYGAHTGSSNAFYLQTDLKYKKLNVSLGGRLENNRTDTIQIEYKPVLRTGINYAIVNGTNVRASFGQGYRFPSVAERYVNTNVGALQVISNDSLTTEFGYSYEVGVQQGYKLGKLVGYVDVAYFVMRYRDMMEFTFKGFAPVFPPKLQFRSENIGNTKLSGIDITWFADGMLGKIPLSILAGYTYVDPRYTDKEIDTLGTAEINVLKYRNRNIAKFDLETGYKRIRIGGTMKYYSRVQNIDIAFEAFIAGVKQYNDKHTQDDIIFDARIIYNVNEKVKVGGVVKNLTNAFYVDRPANPQAPRSFNLQASLKF